MWREYNPNPTGRRVEDCAVRAIAKALNTDWETAYSQLAATGFLMGDLPNANSVWGALLRKNGFKRYSIPNTCPECYTAEEFATDHNKGVFVLSFGKHVATVKNGDIYDSWDSSQEIPQYYWTTEE